MIDHPPIITLAPVLGLMRITFPCALVSSDLGVEAVAELARTIAAQAEALVAEGGRSSDRIRALTELAAALRKLDRVGHVAPAVLSLSAEEADALAEQLRAGAAKLKAEAHS